MELHTEASANARAKESHDLNVPAYLERMNYRGPLEPDAETLRRLQAAHMLAVPFENLSIHWKEPIELDDGALFEKIVRRRRGGFCYELNGLFAALLRALGFDVSMLSAGVFDEASGEFGPEFDHMTLMVNLERRYIADVGFGDSFREPLLLDERAEQREGDAAYRIDEEEDRLILLRRDAGARDWQPQYRFSLQPHVYADYAEMCLYHQTSPDSHFTRKRVCSLAAPEGRVTLSDMRLITTRGGARSERELGSDDEYAKTLQELFGVVAAR